MIWQIILPDTPLGAQTAEKYKGEFEKFNIQLLAEEMKGVYQLIDDTETETANKIHWFRLASTQGAKERFKREHDMRQVVVGTTQTLM